jgi:hypothetical protein
MKQFISMRFVFALKEASELGGDIDAWIQERRYEDLRPSCFQKQCCRMTEPNLTLFSAIHMLNFPHYRNSIWKKCTENETGTFDSKYNYFSFQFLSRLTGFFQKQEQQANITCCSVIHKKIMISL